MKINGKKLLKVTGAFCAATGVVALSGLVASGAAVGAVVEGFKSAKDTMVRVLSENTNNTQETVKVTEIVAETKVEDVVEGKESEDLEN